MDKPIPEAVRALADRVERLLTAWGDDEMRAERDAIAADLRALTAAQQQDHIPDASQMVAQQGQAVALPKLKQTDPSHSRAEMQWVFGYNAALADVMCLNRTTAPPPSVPESVLIGESRDEGVIWFRDNPHAHTVGTKFYAAAPSAKEPPHV